MSFFAYTVLGDGSDSHLQQMSWLSSMGVQTASSVTDTLAHVTGVRSPREVGAALAELGSARDGLEVEIDGVVVKADSSRDRELAGVTGSSPRWAVAYKFPAEERTTKVLAIEVTPGRTGNLGVRAELEPVFVGGATVSFATLHHPGEVQRLDVRVGDTVLVKRAGDVIPRIEGVMEDLRPESSHRWVAPTRCPRCQGELDTSSKRWRCVRGRACGAKEALTYACSRDALDIEGMGERLIGQLVDEELVVELDDMYSLRVDQLVDLDRMGETSAQKVVANIAASKDRPLSRQLVALGIRMTGRSMCRRLAGTFKTLDALRAAGVEELAAVDGVGAVRAAVIRQELDELSDLLDRLVAAGVRFEAGESVQRQVLAGCTVVVSGSMGPALGNRGRNEMHEWLESLGAKASSSVSKNTTYLVTDETGTSKARKAVDLGVQVLSCAEFAALIAGGGPRDG
jgi:DNA ligase (NAD+)